MKERKMIQFHSGFETPVRPGLLRLNSEFNCSPHPIMTREIFRVSGSALSPSSCRAREFKKREVGRAVFGSPTGPAMGAANA